MIKKVINLILKKYVWYEERIKEYYNYLLPYEKEVILIDEPKEDITLCYYLVVFYYYLRNILRRYNIYIGNTDYKIDFLVKLRDKISDYQYRIFKNKNPLIVVKEIREDISDCRIVKKPIFNLSIKINNEELDYNTKKLILSYYFDNLLIDVLNYYGYHNIDSIEVKRGLKSKKWNDIDIYNLRIMDIAC